MGRQAVSVVDILRNKSLSEYIQGVYPDDNLELQPDGTWRCACPLHGGKNTSSFTVFSDNRYYCYSCQKSGDIFSYVMNREGLLFFQTLELLADKYSLDLTKDEKYTQQKSVALLNEKLCRTFEGNLDKVYDYLTKKRGLTDNTIKLFRCGFTKNNEYDKSGFGALTIAMHDMYGRLCGFGYRFFDQKPKYINSKVNELFQKGSYLFNVNNAMRMIPKQKCLYIVEGHIDAMSIHQMGKPCVAYCGITFTKEHVKIIKQITERIEGITIYLVPDNDGKADKFVERGRLLFAKHYPDANVKVVKIQ